MSLDQSAPKSREIIATIRNESSHTSGWKIFGYLITACSAVALPLIFWIGASRLQTQSAENSTRQEYLKLAVSILSVPITEDPRQPHLRDWAVSLISEYAPKRVDLSDEAKADLRSGKITLPCDGCYPPVSIDNVSVTPPIAGVGEQVTFEVTYSGGDNRYAVMWDFEGSLVGDDKWYRTQYQTVGEKVITVRVVSNGRTAFAQAKVTIVAKE